MANRIGIAVLCLAFLASLLRVLTLQSGSGNAVKTTIRLAHWQMEADVKQAIDDAAREYEKLHPDTNVEQIIIGERGYISWITTRLIGGTAPDLIAVSDPELYQRYFLPLSAEIAKPNPYNVGTDLETVTWKETYYDGMAGGYVASLWDYYSVPASAFTVRIFYNKELFQRATGLSEPPAEFSEFIKACERITEYGRESGHPLIPIAGAGKYNAKPLWERFDNAVNSSLSKVTDLDRNGEAGERESIVTLIDGTVSLKDPRIEAAYRGRDYYNKQFQPGFFGSDRMDAAFLFLQQRAVMIASGSWDAGSYFRQADFKIGIASFPIPEKTDPEFGKFVEGPSAEELKGGFAFSINKSSPHREAALDFLKFLSSQKINDQINRRMKWIPMIRGNKPDPFIAPFWPQIDGVRPGISLEGGPQNRTVLEGLQNLHAIGRLSFSEMMDRYALGFIKNSDQFVRVDFPRNTRLALYRTEFTKVSEHALAKAMGTSRDKELAILEGQMTTRHDMLESLDRYEEARKNPKLK